MLFTALKIVERVPAGILYRAETFLFFACGDGLYNCELVLKRHNFSFSGSPIHHRYTNTTAVETRDYTPTGQPSTSKLMFCTESALARGNAQ